MSDETSTPAPDIQDPADYMERLTFHPGAPVTDEPPVLAEDEDVLIPRSFKLPQRLDEALAQIAGRQGVTKSELIRRYLETAVADELATDGEPDVLIPLSEALRALAGLRHLPRIA
jgi:hypothetical protein